MIDFPLQAFFITLFFVFTFVAETCIAEQKGNEYIIFTPKRIYNRIGVNKFGAWVITVFLRIINPIGTIGKFVHFAFTNGREKNE